MSTIETTPVIVISGVAEPPMAAVSVALEWDLPTAVAVRHEIDPVRERLIRTVSDSDGLIERIEIDVEHACVSCAIRQDVVPTLERLAASGRWQAIIAQLPPSADATQVCRVLGYQPASAPHLRIAATVAALEGGSVHDDLLGDDLLTERQLPVRDDDPRGVAETASAMVEYADVVVAHDADVAASDLIRAIARPDARLLSSVAELDAGLLLAGVHRHRQTEEWVQVVRREELPRPADGRAWMLDFRSERPFHPDRLQQRIELLGRGRRRSRGCFWLPSRPTQVCQWDGAGGMVSIGHADDWDDRGPFTRIVVVGVEDDRDRVAQEFGSCLLTDAELAERGAYWEVGCDGLEPWLGPVHSQLAEWS